MGECFITRRGGSGGGKAFAVISVTYPAGSVCTCSDGTKTLSLKDTSGQGFFLIPYAGTWIVTATDGTNTKSESVEITSEGQSKSVELSYWHGELYYNGNQYVDITGGWIKYENTITITFGASSITATGGVSGSLNTSAIYTSKKVDLSAYNALRVTATNDSTYIAYAQLRVTNSNSQPDVDAVSYSNLEKGTNIETTLDVSSLSGEYYISIYFRNQTANFTITKIEML